jgi:hypothetical protein
MRFKKTFFLSGCFLFLFSMPARLFAQSPKHKIAIFAPLFLDSAFDATDNYRYSKQFPKFINPGLEFYEGAQLALDSLAKQGVPLEVFVYDTRSGTQTLAQQLENADMQGLEMIIAYATPQETWSIASAARTKKIPYINVNLPNDGGVTNNAYFVMLNSTLRTHVDRIYRYIQKNFSLDPIIVFRKKGQMEDVIKSYFDETGKSTMSIPLHLKYVDLPDSFSVHQLAVELDSNKHSIAIAGSLDENFGRRLIVSLATLDKHYPITVMGMPTFDNISKDFSRPEYKGLEIIYSTPFYNPRTDAVSLSIINYFTIKMYARPTDMVMRGYEATWRFANLLNHYGKDISSNLSRKEFNVFRELDIELVINRQTNTLDYFENKKLFFIRTADGIIKGVD